MRACRAVAIVILLISSFSVPALAGVPLSLADLETLLRSKVSSSRIVNLLKERRASIELTKETVRKLKGLGANKSVISAVERNNLSSLQIASEPSGAEVFIDRRYKGTTPLQISNIPVGRHNLMLSKVEGYGEYETDVTLSPGQAWKSSVELKKRNEPLGLAADPPPQAHVEQGKAGKAGENPVPSASPVTPPKSAVQSLKVVVRVRTEPVNANIYLDDKYIGESPAEFLATVGSHQLKLVPTLSTKYETVQKEISVRNNELNVVFLRLDSKRN